MQELIERVRAEIASLSKDEIKAKITEFRTAMEAAVEAGELVKATWDTTHRFAKGAYCREFFVKEGTLIVGKIHHCEHFLFALKGEITVLSENGVETIKAPSIMVSKPGIQRIGYAHTDTRWVGVFPTDETDIDILEETLFSETYDEYYRKEGITNVLSPQK